MEDLHTGLPLFRWSSDFVRIRAALGRGIAAGIVYMLHRITTFPGGVMSASVLDRTRVRFRTDIKKPCAPEKRTAQNAAQERMHGGKRLHPLKRSARGQAPSIVITHEPEQYEHTRRLPVENCIYYSTGPAACQAAVAITDGFPAAYP
jgi:hypothetical protein